jgi:hypothetical protein
VCVCAITNAHMRRTHLCVLARAATAPVVGATNALALQAASATHRMFIIGAMMLFCCCLVRELQQVLGCPATF